MNAYRLYPGPAGERRSLAAIADGGRVRVKAESEVAVKVTDLTQDIDYNPLYFATLRDDPVVLVGLVEDALPHSEKHRYRSLSCSGFRAVSNIVYSEADKQ